METTFRVTDSWKDAVKDDYNEGEIGGMQTFTLDCHLSANSIEELAEKIKNSFALSNEPLRWEQDELLFQAMENGEGYEASESELEAWRNGEVELWACDFHFTIEKVVSAEITDEDWGSIQEA